MASVASHSCAVGNPIQQKKNHFAGGNGEKKKVKPVYVPHRGQGALLIRQVNPTQDNAKATDLQRTDLLPKQQAPENSHYRNRVGHQ